MLPVARLTTVAPRGGLWAFLTFSLIPHGFALSPPLVQLGGRRPLQVAPYPSGNQQGSRSSAPNAFVLAWEHEALSALARVPYLMQVDGPFSTARDVASHVATNNLSGAAHNGPKWTPVKPGRTLELCLVLLRTFRAVPATGRSTHGTVESRAADRPNKTAAWIDSNFVFEPGMNLGQQH